MDGCIFGLAGLDHKNQYDDLSYRLKEKGFKNLYMYNDGYLAVKANCKNGIGIALNCGTGICCNGIDCKGKLYMFGGLRYFSGDIGGENIVQNAYQAVYRNFILNSSKTNITEKYFEKFDIKTKDDFIDSVIRFETEKDKQTLIDIFFEAVDEKDPVTLELVYRMAKNNTDLVNAVYSELTFNLPIDVVFAGSIHTKVKNRIYIDMMMEMMTSRCGRIFDFNIAHNEGVQGTIHLMLGKI